MLGRKVARGQKTAGRAIFLLAYPVVGFAENVQSFLRGYPRHVADGERIQRDSISSAMPVDIDTQRNHMDFLALDPEVLRHCAGIVFADGEERIDVDGIGSDEMERFLAIALG